MIFSVRDYVGVGTAKLRRTRRHLSLLCAGNNGTLKGLIIYFQTLTNVFCQEVSTLEKKIIFLKSV